MVNQALTRLPRWQRQGQALVLTAMFPDFVQAMAFMNQLGGTSRASGTSPGNYDHLQLGDLTPDDPTTAIDEFIETPYQAPSFSPY